MRLCRGEVFAVLARLVMFSLYFRCIRCFIVSRLIWFVCPWRMSSTTCAISGTSARRGVTNQSTHSKQRVRRIPSQVERAPGRVGCSTSLYFEMLATTSACFFSATTGNLHLPLLCFTPKQQSLHWKQQSPPTTHQLGEPLLCFSVYIFFTDQILQLVRQPRRWKNERVDETGRFESGLHPLTLLRPIFHTEHVRKRRPRLGHSVGRTAHEGRSLVSPFIRHVGDRSVPALDRRASARQGGAVRRAQP